MNNPVYFKSGGKMYQTLLYGKDWGVMYCFRNDIKYHIYPTAQNTIVNFSVSLWRLHFYYWKNLV